MSDAKPKFAHSIRGFSVVEMLITAAIIGAITAIVTLKYGSFNNLILLKNQAFQIGLELRETQARALSAVGSGGEYRVPYGVYFSTNQRDRYIIFIDSNSNGYYNAGEALDTRTLDSRFQINRLCDGSSCGLTSLSVTFRRPNFDAIMNNGTVAANGGVEISTVSGTHTRTVNINAAGQIMVE